MVVALGVLEDAVFQIADFFFETVELGQEEFFLFCFVAETALNLFVFALLSFAASVGGDAAAFGVLGPIGAHGCVSSCRPHVGRYLLVFWS